MCGIIGINERNDRLMNAAMSAIRYRGPDAAGAYSDEFVTLGHDRLSIIDLDQRSTQPMWDTEMETCIVFNGEIYNFKELRAELEQEFQFQTTSDTEVLIYGHKKYGAHFVERLRGMFAYAIYDRREKKITLFRDHAGIKPLYYYHNDGLFLFASETKAVMRGLGLKHIRPTINETNLKMFYGFGYIPSPYTLYHNLHKVPRGSYLEYDLEQDKIIGIEQFSSPISDPKSEAELFELIEKSILDHLVADVPVGIFFSGGTDSSLIASVLHAHGVDLEAFSIAVTGRSGDSNYFTAIAKTLGIRAQTYAFGVDDFNEIYEKVMQNIDEPSADISIFPTYFVSKKASSKVKVVLSGEGGDELFFGYDRQRILARMRSVHSRGVKLTLLERLLLYTPSFRGKNRIFEKLFAAFRQPLSTFILFMSPSRDITDPKAWMQAKETLLEVAHDPLYFDRDLYLENDLLRKTDVATMLNSIEGRVPLLDPLIISGAQNFEDTYNPAGTSKPVLKRMLERYLPHDLVYRPKSGFGMSLPGILPKSPALAKDLNAAIEFLANRSLIFARLPKSRAQLVRRYPNLCLALICLYRSIENNEAQLTNQ